MSTPTAIVTLNGVKTLLPSGTETIGPLVISNANSGSAVSDYALLSGNNTITVPGTQYVAAIIIPVAGNTTALILKGVGGDTGVPLNLTNYSVYSFPAGTVSFVLNAAGSTSVEINWV